jgi:hypothetical protein
VRVVITLIGVKNFEEITLREEITLVHVEITSMSVKITRSVPKLHA